MEINVEKLIWKSEYNTGDYKIDSEHKALFSLAKRALHIAEKTDLKNDSNNLKEIITELFTYVATHFSNEEKYMEKLKYPELTAHKLIHKRMIKMLKSLIDELSSLALDEIKEKLFDFINEYFIKHIMLEDRKIKIYSTPLSEYRKSFGWKEIYSVKDENIDKEHKRLFDIASKVFEKVPKDERVDKMRTILAEVYDYMKIHFRNEEKYMKEIVYPKLEEHKSIHMDIINKLNEFIKELPQLDIDIAEKELAKTIDVYLVQHIIQEDRKLTDWLNRK